MVKTFFNFPLIILLLTLGGCASRLKDKMKAYREAYAAGDLPKATVLLKDSGLEKEKNSELLWELEAGTLALSQSNETEAIKHLSAAIDLIDKLYTKKISAKAASFLINDASDVFYGASYERSYAHYFLSKAYYSRFLKNQEKLDLQGARATILAWDSYFSELQRSAAAKTIYQTDLMLKIFGAEVHEVSQIRNDKQIALQLYKDALQILDGMGGAFSVFNTSNADYIKALVDGKKPEESSYLATNAQKDLKNFIQYKILSLTKDMRSSELNSLLKMMKPSEEVVKKLDEPTANVVIVLEEGLIPEKVGKVFNFGLKGAIDSIDSPGAKAFISTVGAEVLTAFAMTNLGMNPQAASSTGSFIFAHDVTRLAVQEAAIAFELPMIENSPVVKDLKLVILDEKGSVLRSEALAIVSENGDIAKLVLEEDIVNHYVKTGTRVAVKHLLAIVAAMQVYNKLKDKGAFIAHAASMATYVGASKGIAALEKADTRHWTTLPQLFRMTEVNLAAGNYQIALIPTGSEVVTANLKILGNIKVNNSGKSIHSFRLVQP